MLATSRPQEIGSIESAYKKAGVQRERACESSDARCYPLGGVLFSVLGDWDRQTNWGARNASFLERDSDTRLKGFDDGQRVVSVVNPRTGAHERTIKRDYTEILPLARHGFDSSRPGVSTLLARPRDLRSSIDARLQVRVASALRTGITRGGHTRGAAVVIDVDSGEVLASVSYPWPAAEIDKTPASPADSEEAAEALLDRARYGLYPPGSTFKLLVAGAALRSSPAVQNADVRVRPAAGRPRREFRSGLVAARPRRSNGYGAARRRQPATRARRIVQRVLRAAGTSARASADP